MVRYTEKFCQPAAMNFWIIDDSAFLSQESSYEKCTAADVGRVAVFL